jgi:60 kDa SS-A/Ro ribonucleoprotein
MANKQLFKSGRGAKVPPANTYNNAGGLAYSMSAEQALAQFAVTGCLNSTYYASDERQLEEVKALAAKCEPEFVARVAIYSRRKAYMKDMPALLCAILASREPAMLEKVFERVINDARMLRNFVQVLRSGVTGRKSLGSLPKRLVRKWLAARTEEELFQASVGNSPSMADVVKMVHPKPGDAKRAAMYGYLLGKKVDETLLPDSVLAYEIFKAGEATTALEAPDVPMQMLTHLELAESHWKQIARRASWQTTRMNLNTFARHGVFKDEALTAEIAARLVDETQVRRARVFPYQLMVARTQADASVPSIVRGALERAMEIAISNVPRIEGKVYVFPDVSGSMQSPITGHRKGATTAVRCIDVAALVAAAVLRRNREAEVIPFSDSVVECRLNPDAPVMVNAEKLAKLPSGGTNCSAPLTSLNARSMTGDLIIYVSDNESWMDTKNAWAAAKGTETMRQWKAFKQRNPAAKLVCIDLTPNATTQATTLATSGEDVLNVGGFSDQVFDVVSAFARGDVGAGAKGHWVEVIRSTEL